MDNWSRSSTLVLPPPLPQPESGEDLEGRSIIQRLLERNWVQPAIGLTTLLITLIALFVYSHRSFVMAKWTEKNDMLQACAQLIQVRSNATYPQCQAMLSAGPTPPPYIRNSKQWFQSQTQRLSNRALDVQNTTKEVLDPMGYSDSRRQSERPLVNLGHSLSVFGPAGWFFLSIWVLAAIGSIGFYTRNKQKFDEHSRSQGGPQDSAYIFRTIRTDPTVSTIQKLQAYKQCQPGQERVLKQIRRRVRPHSSSGSQPHGTQVYCSGFAVGRIHVSALAASPPATDNGKHLVLNPASLNATLGPNFAVDCNGAAYGIDLNIKSCAEAQKLIPTSDSPSKFGQRGRQGVDVLTPWRWVSSDGQCVIEVPETILGSVPQGSYLDLSTAADEMIEVCLEYKDHPEGSQAKNIVNQLYRSQLVATVDLTTTNQDVAAWYDVWAATAAIDAMCVRKGRAGSASWMGE
ncbi:MAG: hypothetical protein Q9218_002085 [Villophora microphyllina]